MDLHVLLNLDVRAGLDLSVPELLLGSGKDFLEVGNEEEVVNASADLNAELLRLRAEHIHFLLKFFDSLRILVHALLDNDIGI